MELEEELRRKIAQIQPLDERAMALAKKRWDMHRATRCTSLGLLEDAIVTIAGAQGTHQVELNKRCVTAVLRRQRRGGAGRDPVRAGCDHHRHQKLLQRRGQRLCDGAGCGRGRHPG